LGNRRCRSAIMMQISLNNLPAQTLASATPTAAAHQRQNVVDGGDH
jgi:hypothetical protein